MKINKYLYLIMGNQYSIKKGDYINEGGFAKVYKSVKPGTEEPCAVKIFNDSIETMTQ